MTTAAFGEAHRIWHVATLQRDPKALKTMSAFALFLVAAVPIVAGVSLYHEHTLPVLLLLRILLGIGAFWTMIVWVWLFVPSAVMMNSAANARLLPRQRRRLVQMTVGGWLLLALAATAAIGDWLGFPFVALYTLGFGLMRAGNMAALALTILPGFWPLLSRHVLPAPLVQALSGPVGLSVVMVVLVLSGAFALARMIPRAGDRHLDARGEQLKRMNRSGTGGWAFASENKGLMTVPSLRVYAAILRRDSSDSRVPRADAMLMHALGPAGHWSAWIGSVILLVLMHLAGYAVVVIRGEAVMRDFVNGFSWGGLSGLGFMIAFSTSHIRQQLDRTRGEQALLRLTPLAGDRALLNRRLAGRMLGNALLQWSALTGMVLLMGSLFGGAELLLRQFALCCLGGQAALAILFGDFARTPKVGIVRGTVLGVMAVAEMALAAGLGWLCGSVAVWTWPWLIVFSVGIGAFQLRRGWTTLLGAPVAFPAGRLS